MEHLFPGEKPPERPSAIQRIAIKTVKHAESLIAASVITAVACLFYKYHEPSRTPEHTAQQPAAVSLPEPGREQILRMIANQGKNP